MSSQMYYKDYRVKRLKKFETKDFFKYDSYLKIFS
jgi:hypothetical protein